MSYDLWLENQGIGDRCEYANERCYGCSDNDTCQDFRDYLKENDFDRYLEMTLDELSEDIPCTAEKNIKGKLEEIKTRITELQKLL